MSIESYIRAMPKAELHVHLEGAISPCTLLQLARRNGVKLSADTAEDLQRWFVYRDFDHFTQIYVTACECLRHAEDFELIVYEFGAEMARQNVRYAEVSVSAPRHRAHGIPFETYFAGITRGRARARQDFGVDMQWIFTIIRQWPDRAMTEPMAAYVTDAAIEGMAEGVVALGLAGLEAGAAPEPFRPWFDRARTSGLHTAPHAGEMMGPESVRGAIDALGAERIAHGVRAIEDPALVRYLAEHPRALDVCPRSNICLGVYTRLEDHPLPRLHRAGVTITVNSDDPAMFNTDLTDELLCLAGPFGLDVAAIDDIALNAVRHSFLSPERKAQLEREFRQEMDELKRVHLA